MGIQRDIGRVVHAQQIGAARSQRQAAVGIQARAAEAGVQGGEVVDIGERHRHVRGAGQLAIGVFQRRHVLAEAAQHGVVLGGAAHDAVSHVSP